MRDLPPNHCGRPRKSDEELERINEERCNGEDDAWTRSQTGAHGKVKGRASLLLPLPSTPGQGDSGESGVRDDQSARSRQRLDAPMDTRRISAKQGKPVFFGQRRARTLPPPPCGQPAAGNSTKDGNDDDDGASLALREETGSSLRLRGIPPSPVRDYCSRELQLAALPHCERSAVRGFLTVTFPHPVADPLCRRHKNEFSGPRAN
jgi:hypothetical protein